MKELRAENLEKTGKETQNKETYTTKINFLKVYRIGLAKRLRQITKRWFYFIPILSMNFLHYVTMTSFLEPLQSLNQFVSNIMYFQTPEL